MSTRGAIAAARFARATDRTILAAATPREWVDAAVADLPTLLVDHANCEKKAASTAMALIFAYPEDRSLAVALSRLARGVEPGPESSVVKLHWTEMTQHLSSLALDVVGAGAPIEGEWPRQWLWSQAASIAGGTSEIQRTIIGERLLGLPRS